MKVFTISLAVVYLFAITSTNLHDSYNSANAETVNARPAEAEASAIPEEAQIKWEDLLTPQLRALCTKETHCNPDKENPMDTDGLRKYGLFQYDVYSFFDVNKVCGILPNLELEEVVNVIKDPFVQIKMTDCAIDDGQGWRWGKNLIQ